MANTLQGASGIGIQEAISESVLWTTDFDDTLFLTSQQEEGVKIATVNDAYAEALTDELGSSARDAFVEGGGHLSRAVPQIVSDLQPDMTEAEIAKASVRVTLAKIAILCDQIGKRLPDGALWPRVMPGLPAIWNEVASRNHVNPGLMTTAVLSAGHVPFIMRAFEVQGLAQPDEILTDEVLIEQCDMADVPHAERTKPATMLLEVAHISWLCEQGVEVSDETLNATKNRITYSGDSVDKDGGMAYAYGIDFTLIHPDHSKAAWMRILNWLELGGRTLITGAGG